jgi:membrane-bound ClpP family serine protease
VRFQGTSWPAESYGEVLKAGEKVQILKRENLTLIVTRSFLNGDT